LLIRKKEKEPGLSAGMRKTCHRPVLQEKAEKEERQEKKEKEKEKKEKEKEKEEKGVSPQSVKHQAEEALPAVFK
jgi:hypothetical protein